MQDITTSATNHSVSTSGLIESKNQLLDLPLQSPSGLLDFKQKRDTPQLDRDYQINESILQTIRRVINNTDQDSARFSFNDNLSSQRGCSTREQRKKRIFDCDGNASSQPQFQQLTDNKEEASSSSQKKLGGGNNNNDNLSFLYSSVKSVLKDNLAQLDFSKKQIEPVKRQQLRYHINTHDSEQSFIQDGPLQVVYQRSESSNNLESRRRSSQTNDKLPFDYYNNNSQSAKQLQSSGVAMNSCSSEKSLTTLQKRQELILSSPDAQVRLSQQRFYQTFNRDQQQQLSKDTGVFLKPRGSNQSRQESVKINAYDQEMRQMMDPSTPMFCSQKPSSNSGYGGNIMFQSMQIPKPTSDEDSQKEELKEPQIISRTLGLMRLNTSSSCQSIESMKDEVLNLTIRRQQFVSAEEDGPVLLPEVTNDSISSKKKNSLVRKTSSQRSSNGSTNFSKTQRMANTASQSHQHSKLQLQNHSRVLSPLSQKSNIQLRGAISLSTTPVNKSLVANKRPKSSSNPLTKKSVNKSMNTSFNAIGVGYNLSSINQSRQSSFGQGTTKSTVKRQQTKPTGITKKQRPASSFSTVNSHTLSFFHQPQNLRGGTFSPTGGLHYHTGFATNTTASSTTNKQQTFRAPHAPTCSTPGTVRHFPKPAVINQRVNNNKQTTSRSISNKNMTVKHQNIYNTISALSSASPLLLPKQLRTRSNLLTSKQSLSTIRSKENTPVNLAAQKMGKCSSLIRKGLQKKGQVLSDKNEVVSKLMAEKKELGVEVQNIKKEVLQTQKQAKAIRDNNRQIEDDIVRLSELVNQKADRNIHLERDVQLAKRDVKQLHQDCEELRFIKTELVSKIEGEYQLVDVVQKLIVNLKKQLNEVRRDKEKVQIAIRGEQKRAMDVINKRRYLITEETEKIYFDFKETMGGGQPSATPIPQTLHTCSSMTGAMMSRSQLHTPKGEKANAGGTTAIK